MLAQDKEEMKVLYIKLVIENSTMHMGLVDQPIEDSLGVLVLTDHFVCPVHTVHQAKLAELQDLVMRLVAERNDWYNRYTGAVAGAGSVNPDLLPVGEDQTHLEHQAHTHSEPNALNRAGRHIMWCHIIGL